jgi:hypothetical protein
MACIEVDVRHEGVMLITTDLGECAAPDVNCLTFRKNINV